MTDFILPENTKDIIKSVIVNSKHPNNSFAEIHRLIEIIDRLKAIEDTPKSENSPV